MFHQKQFRNYCRCHAINNFLGYNAVSYQQFDKYCDEFDVKNNMPLISKNNCYFYNNGGMITYLVTSYKKLIIIVNLKLIIWKRILKIN